MAKKRKEKWKAVDPIRCIDRWYVTDPDGAIIAILPHYNLPKAVVGRWAKRIALLPELERALLRLANDSWYGVLTSAEWRLVEKVTKLTTG